MISNGFNNGIKLCCVLWRKLSICVSLSHFLTGKDYLKTYGWKIKKGDYFPSLCSKFSVFLFYPSFHPSLHTADSPPLCRCFVLSLSQCSCPLLIFSSIFFPPSTHSLSSTLLSHYFHHSFSPTHPGSRLCPSLMLFPPLSCGSWALCGDATPKTPLLVPLLVPWR